MRVLLYGIRQRPILPGRVQPSTFGTEGLNFCVRDGNRWDPFVIATGNCELVKWSIGCFRGLPRLSALLPFVRFASFRFRSSGFLPARFLSSALRLSSVPLPFLTTVALYHAFLPLSSFFRRSPVLFRRFLCLFFCTLTTAQLLLIQSQTFFPISLFVLLFGFLRSTYQAL